jgi:indole-3-glycerol phosphate synthase
VSGTGQSPPAGEGRLERVGRRVLGASGRVVGVRVARRVAWVMLRIRARSAAGWLEGVHRVATRPAPGAPALTRLPARWWTTSPRVRARRLGLRLELDLRDNLERTLYATGTYEPALLRFLHDELRPGDVALDVGAHIGVHALPAAARNRLDVEGAELTALRGMAGSLARLRPRALVVEVKDRVLDRAGVDGDEVRGLLGRLGYEPTGQVLAVANEVYRPVEVPGSPGVGHHQDVGELHAIGRELGPGHRTLSRAGLPLPGSSHGSRARLGAVGPERLESWVVTSTGSFLARAVADARSDAERRAERLPLDDVRAAAVGLPAARGLEAAVRRGLNGPRVIAEVKRRSPSKGDIRIDLDPAALAGAYAAGGASAVSVLTEPRHFAGSPDDLLAVRSAVDLPVLRKDFVTTPYQVWEARAWGADAVLLIVAALDPPALRDLLEVAAEAGLDALVEVHTLAEAEVAAAAGASLVGVNARDLATLEVDPARFAEVRQALPAGTVLVAESGIRDRAGVQAAADAGADAVLVGESLVRATDPAAAVRALLAVPTRTGGAHG